jgi:hypothetical protein
VLLIIIASALVAGGCLAAARLGGPWGTAAALAGFAAYLSLFVRGLEYLPVDWKSWRERNYSEYEERDDRSEENNGGKT